MFAPERIKIIKNIILDKEQVEVAALSQTLAVSEVTIRRDLEKLEADGFLVRTHGGAVLNEEKRILEELTQPLSAENSEENDEIALCASHFIEDGDVIMLTDGFINRCLSKKIASKKNLTILTNDMVIALELSQVPSLKVTILGGNVDFSTRATFGPLANSNAKKFYVDKLFMEIDGITEQLQFTASSPEKATLIQEAALNANEKLVLCSSRAFERASFYKIGSINMAGKLITSAKISDNQKKSIFHHDIKLYTSINLFEGRV